MRYPEPSLLTQIEFRKLHEDFFGKGSCDCSEIDDTDLCYRVAEAQRQKDIKFYNPAPPHPTKW